MAASKKLTKTDTHKKAMIEALKANLGIVSHACDKVGITRQTHYDWIKKDKQYKQDVENTSEYAIDFVESKLFEKINGVTLGKETEDGLQVFKTPPSDTAIIFYLKTKGKQRGYVERQQVEDVSQQKVLNITYKRRSDRKKEDNEKD